MVLASHFSDEDSDNDEVAKVGVDEDPDFDEINFQRMIEKSKYANRYANFGNEDEARQIDNLRRSSEAWGRQSITSLIQRRQSLKSNITNFATN